jgi:5-methylcytosine-specific restriction enzyme subunit McrC
MCLQRLYHRLNDDYRPMHALCRFFLEQTGASLDGGDHDMVPFVLNVNQLFELFVAEWLAAALPPPLRVNAQHVMRFGEGGQIEIRIDLVLENRLTGEVVAVMDTKYKRPDKPSSQDIEQVVAYASANACHEAVLIYPAPLETNVDAVYGQSGVRVRSLVFDIGGELDEAGARLMSELIGYDAGVVPAGTT